MRYFAIVLAVLFTGCFFQQGSLLLDDFEGVLSPKTVDFGGGNGSEIKVSSSNKVFFDGKQSLKIEYNSVPSGYMWVARGYGLDVKGAAQWKEDPKNIKWKKYKGLSFALYGQGKGATIAVDIKDKNKEIFRTMIKDDTKGWKTFICPFSGFFSRSDWQPETALVDNVLDFPVMSFQVEVRSLGKGVIYLDKLELIRE